MESIKESCDPNDTDWSQVPLVILMGAAEDGIENAQKELRRRQLQLASALNDSANNKLGTVTPKFSIEEIED